MRCSLLTLSCYLDAELEARQHGEMEAHLVGCPRCRAGLSHLREEMERVGGLARVRVPDRSARAMMELLGLIARGQDLPPRPADVPDAPVSELPWLGAQVGPALPWASPPRVPRGTPPHPPAAAPPAAAEAMRPDELPVLTAPAAAPGRTADEEAAREEADVALMAPVDLLRPAVPILPAVLVPAKAPAAVVPPAPSPPDAPVPAAAPHAPPTPNVSDTPPAPAAPEPPPPSGETPVAVTLPDTPEAFSLQAGPAADAHAADPMAGALLAAAAQGSGPLPAPRPSLFDRFREKLAMRRALSGNPDADLEDGVEVVSGMGAPVRSGSSRADLARRRTEALRPAAADAAAAEALARGPRAGEMLPPPARPSALRPSPPTNLYGIPVDPFGRPPRAEPASGGVRRAPAMAPPPPSAPAAVPRAFVPPPLIEEQRLAAAPPPLAGRPPPAATEPAGRRPASPSELREGRRLLFLYVGAVVILFVIGLVSARTTTPLPTSSISTSSTSTSSTSTGSGATAQKPAAVLPGSTHPTAAPVAPTAAPAPLLPAAPPAPRTVGAGGSGWQIQQFRFGDHTTYYLMVLDIAGSGAPPTVTVASQGAQTLLLTIAGTAPAIGPALPPPGGWVSRVMLVTPSPTPGAAVYRIFLSKPGSGSPSLLTGPSRIVIEIR
ncbi:MAG TPA: zf-HC2 domain-containing protein [Candidatus Dormibacteraeota bacterium]